MEKKKQREEKSVESQSDQLGIDELSKTIKLLDSFTLERLINSKGPNKGQQAVIKGANMI